MSAGDRQLEGATHDPELDAPHEQAMREARELLASVEKRYERALKQTAQVDGSKRIDAAFDEVDRLQREMISAIRRVRELEREASEARVQAASNVRTLPARHAGLTRHAHRPKWARADRPKPPSPREPAA